MGEPPVATTTETPVKVEMKPPKVKIAEASQVAGAKTESSPPLSPDDPHATLQAMAEGKYESQQGKPEEPADREKPGSTETPAKKDLLTHKEEAQQILADTGKTLLVQKDPRFLTVALATSAIDTPLGAEIQRETLKMLAQAQDLPELRGKLQQFNLEAQAGASSALEQFIKDYNIRHQENRIPSELVDLINSTEQPDLTVLQSLFTKIPDFRSELWRETTGLAWEENPADRTTQLLTAAKIDSTPENIQALQGILESVSQKPEGAQVSLMKIVGSSFSLALLLSNIVGGLATETQPQGH